MIHKNLTSGTILGDRFKIEQLIGQGDIGSVYKAKDIKTDRFVALRVISGSQIPNQVDVDKLRVRVQKVSALAHRNIRATFGMGELDSILFIANEWIDGQNLRSLLTKRDQSNKRFSFRGAYNIIGHVCNALTYAHENTFHGCLSPRAIMVNDAGRVKIIDWGLSVFRINLKNYQGRKKVESCFWSPESIKDGNTASQRSDVYSIGALFYELLTGEPPNRPLTAPSKLGFAKDVDTVIARCMSANPDQRYKTAAEIKLAIFDIVKAEEAQKKQASANATIGRGDDDDLGIDIDIDLSDMDAPNLESTLKGSHTVEGHAVNTVVALNESDSSLVNAPGLPPVAAKKSSGQSLANASKLTPGASNIDMGAVLANLGQSESAKWMVQKDKFDHGPFSDRELVQMILKGEVIGKHKLLNIDTGVRKKVSAWEDFDSFLEKYRLKKKEQDEQAALVKTEKSETRGTVFKLVVGLSILGAIGLIVAGYFLQLTLRAEKELGPGEIAVNMGGEEIVLKVGKAKFNKRKGKGKRGKGKGGGRSSGGGGNFANGMTYEEAMNMGMEMGDLGSGGGQKQLTAADIENIMNKNVRKFLPCMKGESIKRVDMNIAVSGSGKVMGVSVKSGSDKLKKCVQRKVRSIKFPSSNAPRTATSWYFELY